MSRGFVRPLLLPLTHLSTYHLPICHICLCSIFKHNPLLNMMFLPLAFSLNVSIHKRTFQLFSPPLLQSLGIVSHSPCWPHTHSVSEAGQEPVSLLPPPPKRKESATTPASLTFLPVSENGYSHLHNQGTMPPIYIDSVKRQARIKGSITPPVKLPNSTETHSNLRWRLSLPHILPEVERKANPAALTLDQPCLSLARRTVSIHSVNQ